MALCLFLSGCGGCDRDSAATSTTAAPEARRSVRLYLMSELAGALEPCGCSKDQLGGLDHLAAFVASQSKHAAPHLVFASGPSFYLDPVLDPTRATQDKWKAEAIARALKSLGLSAFAPGYNDFSAGHADLSRLAEVSGGAMLGAGLGVGLGGMAMASRMLVEQGGIKVGVFGVSDPRDLGKAPEGISPPAAEQLVELVRGEVAALEREGAELLVGLATMDRGAALRIADAFPELDVLLVGRPVGRGAANTAQPAPELVNGVLVVGTANHAQTVAIIDVVATGRKGPLKLADAGGVARARQVEELSKRIRDLENRINGWEKGGTVNAADLAARKADLAKFVAERAALSEAAPPASGDHFSYAVEEVRGRLGNEESVVSLMRDYYKRVNDHNKTALASLVPAKVGSGEAAYVGVDACTDCHAEERAVWDTTAHAHAYKTLADDFKEFNLECVGCHVTGYGKAGGSTVTHVEKLRDVQCEDCHGPGSLHAAAPEKKDLITLAPDPKGCVDRCHHSPHVEGFDAKAKMELVLGTGHGK